MKVKSWDFWGDQGSMRAQVGMGNEILLELEDGRQFVGKGIAYGDRPHIGAEATFPKWWNGCIVDGVGYRPIEYYK